MRKTTICGLLVAAMLATGAAAAFDYEAERQAILDRLGKLAENPEGLGESERLAAFIELYFDYSMLEFPEFASYIGHPTGHDRWTDGSLAAGARRDADTVAALELLRSFDREQLAGDDRLNYDLLLDDLEDSVEGQGFPGEYLAINQMGGVQQSVADMLAIMPARSATDYQNIVARLEKAPALVAQTLERLAKGLEAGVTPPRVTMRDVPQQIQNQLVDDPLASPMLRAFTDFPEAIPAAEQERLRSRAVAAYGALTEAYRRLHDYLVETYIPGCRESIGMSGLPDGEAWYAFRVKQSTTTELTPAEIHQIGLAEVERIRGEMEAIIRDTGFEGSFAEFFDFLRTDPRFFYDDPEELLAGYRDITKRADPELVKLFGRLPRLPYGVTPVPAYAEKSQTTAYYQPGSLEAGRPGQFFANTYDLRSRPKWEMEALSLHEAVPGHHLQIALAQEQEELPWFRRFGGYGAFTEGWGLYAESLGEEMGFYQDSYSKFGQLTYEMWRAVRLVVDTGMHALGWTRQQAIDFFLENAGKAEHDIVVEVDRYIVWPGQALSYKIGELKLQELRRRAEEELGERFDIRAFHDRVLGSGALPLTVLEARIDDWIGEVVAEAWRRRAPAADRSWLTSCSLPGLEERALCGSYEVFENRAARSGRKIPLRVAVLPATGGAPAPDALVFFAGGPGASTVEAAAGLAFQLAELRRERDMLLVDFRGTGESDPLFCPYQQEERGLEEVLESFIPTDRVAPCREALAAERDLTQYTTPILVDDVDEVRAALGYDKLNLIGGSYGSRAALVYLRRHPESVRTVVIEGIAPTDARIPLTFARDAQAALDALLAECAADADCAAAFPDPAADLAKVLARLEAEPAAVEVVDGESGERKTLRFTRNVFVQTLRYMLYSSLQALQVPAFLKAAAEGDFSAFAQMAQAMAGPLLASIPDGLYLSVTCTEDVAFIDPAEAAAAHAGTFLGDFRYRSQRDACRQWVRGELPAGFTGPVVADSPTLVLSGERDPVTPARWGDQVARHLSNSRHLVVPDGAHGWFGLEGVECLDELTTRFIRAGSLQGLEFDACVAGIGRPPFLLEAASPEEIELAEAELERFVGRYAGEQGGFALTIELVDGRLRARFGEDQPFLVPVSPVRFLPEGAPPGTFVEFLLDGDTVTGVQVFQGGSPLFRLVRAE